MGISTRGRSGGPKFRGSTEDVVEALAAGFAKGFRIASTIERSPRDPSLGARNLARYTVDSTFTADSIRRACVELGFGRPQTKRDGIDLLVGLVSEVAR